LAFAFPFDLKKNGKEKLRRRAPGNDSKEPLPRKKGEERPKKRRISYYGMPLFQGRPGLFEV
jgi:hypothetical protein